MVVWVTSSAKEAWLHHACTTSIMCGEKESRYSVSFSSSFDSTDTLAIFFATF